MKLPNGYGTCYRLPGNRRRPFVVKKTVNGRQKILGYFDTFEHGIAYLSSVNASPLLDDDITFSELFARWKATKYDRISLSSRKSYDNAYRHCRKLHNLPFRSIRYGHLQDVIDEIQAGYCTQKKCRGLIGQLYKYAIKYDIVATDYARYIELKPHIRKYKKKPFTVRQRNKLWRAVDTLPAVQDVLILIYTGLRIGEYLRLTPQDVKWRSHYFIVRKSKTTAGQGRAVPIHKDIYPWFVQRKNQAYICQHEDGTPYTYDAFRRRFDKIMGAFGMQHTPHECRHTCASMLDSSGANDTAVKKILGHACRGVTKHDYTHKTIHELRKAIDSI